MEATKLKRDKHQNYATATSLLLKKVRIRQNGSDPKTITVLGIGSPTRSDMLFILIYGKQPDEQISIWQNTQVEVVGEGTTA